MGGGVGEVRWGMAALAKGREEVDQEVVEGTSFPFAPPVVLPEGRGEVPGGEVEGLKE